jgi:hypothetical protein
MFSFNGLPKGHTFEYDDEKDTPVIALVRAGYLKVINEATPPPATIIIRVQGVESGERIGDIGGEGEDQPPRSGGDGDQAVSAFGQPSVSRDEGDGPKVAKGRKPRTDLSTDG